MASILNADNGVVSGTSGLKYASDNSGVIQLQTSGATTLTLDTSKNAVFANSANVTGVLNAGNTVVGTLAANATTISGNVSVTGTQFVNGAVTFANSTSNTAIFAANGSISICNQTVADRLSVTQNDATGPSIRLQSATSNSWINQWGNTGGGSGRTNRFEINASATNMSLAGGSFINFEVGGAGDSYEKLRIDANVLSLTGLQGIKFQTTQSPSSDPNTLDDYEEGTWTPIVTLDGNNTNLAGSYSNREAYYTKIGNVVHYTLDLTASGVSTSSSSFISLSGLPFTAKNGSIYIVASMRDSGLLPSIGSGFIYKPWVQSNSTYIYFQFDSLTTAAYAGTPTNWDSGGRLTLQGWYYTS
jgi:hypothetical protein